ncbi:MAG: hypothetical protein AAFZ49_12790 [Cyanobacteria bacterium J06659_2]
MRQRVTATPVPETATAIALTLFSYQLSQIAIALFSSILCRSSVCKQLLILRGTAFACCTLSVKK